MKASQYQKRYKNLKKKKKLKQFKAHLLLKACKSNIKMSYRHRIA